MDHGNKFFGTHRYEIALVHNFRLLIPFVLHLHKARAVNIPGARFCNMSVFPPTTYTFWIPILVFESLLCTLAIIQGFRTFKYHGSLFSHGNRLMGILVRDSVTYYLLWVLKWSFTSPLLSNTIASICLSYLSCIIVGFKTPVFSLCNLWMFSMLTHDKRQNPYIEVSLGISLAMPSILSSRMILTIREENSEKEHSFTTSSTSLGFSGQ